MDNGYKVYEDGTTHKFGVTVGSFQEGAYYPIERLSTDEMVLITGECKRDGFNNNQLPGDKLPVATGVGRSNVKWKFYLCPRPHLSRTGLFGCTVPPPSM